MLEFHHLGDQGLVYQMHGVVVKEHLGFHLGWIDLEVGASSCHPDIIHHNVNIVAQSSFQFAYQPL